MKNWNIIVTLIIYFVFYIILGNLMSFIMSFFTQDIEIFYYFQFTIEMITVVSILYMSKNLFKCVAYEFPVINIFKVIKYYFYMLVSNMIVSIPISFIANTDTSNNQQAVEAMFEQNLMYSIFASAIFAPIVEEIIYRGIIYKNVRLKCGVKTAILASSTVFAFMHFAISFVSGDLSDMIFLPVYLVPSIFLCLIYEKTNNIFAPIYLHLINNLIGIIAIIWGMILI